MAPASDWFLKWPQHTIRGPFLEEDAGTVAHVYWNGKTLVDTRPNTWTMAGTVPQGAVSPLFPRGFSGTARATAGPYSSSNYYAGTTTDALHLTPGSMTVTVIFSLTSVADHALISNYNGGTGGWMLDISSSKARFLFGAASISSTASLGVGTHIVCFGESGAAEYLKLDGATTNSTAQGLQLAGASATRIGRRVDTTDAFVNGVIYEALASSTAWSEASAAAIQARYSQQFR